MCSNQKSYSEMNMIKEKILLISQFFPPDMAGTGIVMEELAEDLQTKFDVTVLAGKTSYFNKEKYDDYRSKIRVRRIWHPYLNSRSKLGRILNFIFFPLSAAFRLNLLAKAGKIIIVSNPPTIVVVGLIANKLFKKKVYFIWQDMYPDVAVELGVLSKKSVLFNMMKKLNKASFSKFQKIILLSDKMKEYFSKEYGPWASKTTVITNWADPAKIYPENKNNPWSEVSGYKDLFVVLYSGNIGLAYNFDPIIDAAILLQKEKDIVFLFVGEGSQKAYLKHSKGDKNLTNMDFMGYVPNEDYNKLLAAGDCHIVSLKKDLDKFSFPGKIYSSLAAGRPVIAVADKESNLTELVVKNNIGFAVNSGSELADAILQIKNNQTLSGSFGHNSRELALKNFARTFVTKQYLEILEN
jgi:colanic acid biosynthesis glycosyl transferase WcaI